MKGIISLALLLATSLQAADPAPEKKLTILAVGAHMDDAEGGVGGTLIGAAQASTQTS